MVSFVLVHFVLLAEAIQLLFQFGNWLGEFTIAVATLHFHGVCFQIEEFPGVELLVGKADEFEATVSDTIVDGHAVAARLIVVVVVCLSPVSRVLAT